MTRGRLGLLTIGLFVSAFGHGCIFGGCSKNGPPPPDDCNGDTSGDVATLELGAGGVDKTAPFVAWSDGDVIIPVSGDQGLDMVAMRMRLTGTSPPTCLKQTTVVINEFGLPLSNDAHSLKTYVDGDGRATLTLWIPTEFPGAARPISIETTAGGIKTTRRLFTEIAPIVDMAAAVDLAHDASHPNDLATTD